MGAIGLERCKDTRDGYAYPGGGGDKGKSSRDRAASQKIGSVFKKRREKGRGGEGRERERERGGWKPS